MTEIDEDACFNGDCAECEARGYYGPAPQGMAGAYTTDDSLVLATPEEEPPC